MLLSRKLRLGLSLAAVLVLAAGVRGQSLEMGTNVASPNGGDAPFSEVRTDIDLVRPATATGVVDSASVQWSSLGCTGAFEIKFFRRQGDTLVFLDERGPFDTVANPTPVSIIPPFAVQEGDLIGVTRMTNCGNPTVLSGFPSAGYVGYTGDLHSNVSLSAAEVASPDTLAVFATGTASESLVRVIPAVASTPGDQGSFFKTTVQLHNPWSAEVSGRFVFHPAGVSGSSLDTGLSFTVGAGQTVAYPDIVASIVPVGLGSIDVIMPASSQIPIIITRVFNDAGASGTAGLTEDAVNPEGGASEGSLLFAGSTGFLVAPSDLTNFRFNIGVRTFLSGASLTLTVRDANGVLKHTTTKTYDPTYFEQQPSGTFLGVALQANDSIQVSVDSGSAVLYGATADNTTNDPSIQFVKVSFAIL
jgi:hypothetical protein